MSEEVSHDGIEEERSPEEATTELVVVATQFLDAVRDMSESDRSSMGYLYSANGLNERGELVREASESSGQSSWKLRAFTTSQEPAVVKYTLTTDSAAVSNPTLDEWSTSAPMRRKELRRRDREPLSDEAASVDQINSQIASVTARTKAIATAGRNS